MIGAIAMILALGFDPFMQNLVHYDTVYIPDVERNSSMTVANEFDFLGPFGQLGSDAKGRIQSGIYSVSDSLRVPSYSCDTGNCTWLGYNTLGVGVHCADLTSELVQTCSNDTALQVCHTFLSQAVEITFVAGVIKFYHIGFINSSLLLSKSRS